MSHQQPRRRRIGIFGGSFNPVHIGHTMLASYLAQWGGFDSVWLTLSPLNPIKAEASELIDDSRRMAMLRIALEAGETGGHLEACDIELGLPRPSFTYITLDELAARYPDCDFSIIVGSDNWLEFGRWRRADYIIARYGVTVYPRPGYPVGPESLPEGVRLLPDTPRIEISSTFIRRALAGGADMTYFLPQGVYAYIRRNGLYGTTAPIPPSQL